MFARSMYQKSVDEMVSLELKRLYDDKILSADKIYRQQTTQHRIDEILKSQKEVK